jgi:hypothetical protein
MTTLAQRSFAGGEIAPALYARTDTAKYATGLRTLRNFFVMRHGGAASRPGTTFVAEVKDSTKAVRLIPFVFNASQTYVLEFGDLYMRVHKNGVQLEDLVRTINGISNANPGVFTCVAHGFSAGDEVAASGFTGTFGSKLNNRNLKVFSTTTNAFTLTYMDGTPVDTTTWGAWVSGGTLGRVYTLVTPYASSDLPLLKFVQSADVVTLTHPTYAPRELARTGDTTWTITTMTFAPDVATPTGLTSGGSSPGSDDMTWAVTAIAPETGEESLASVEYSIISGVYPTPSSGIVLSWTPVVGVTEYRVYRKLNGFLGFIGIAGNPSFIDKGVTPDTTNSPPAARNPFPGAGDYPGCSSYFQQRRTFGRTNNKPQGVWASQSGKFKNFTTRQPLQDDDAVTFTLVGRQVNEIKHIVDIGKMLILTSGGEWAVEGDASGILKPTGINPKQYSYYGSSDIPPIIIGGNILYLQARGNIVRDLSYDFTVDGYRGNDLTIFSAHLLDGFTVVDWTYSQIPNSIVWAARSDGTLLGLTYVKEQQMAGWHRHDFSGGKVENVCSVPEGSEDYLYLTISRTVNGRTVRYIERMSTRFFTDVIDFVGMDATLSFDGRNTGATTMTLSGGSTWESTETLTLTASTSSFASTDVGNQIFMDILDSAGKVSERIRCTITAYTSATVVSVLPNKTVPVALQGVAKTSWSKAVKQVGGLWHLEGKSLSVFADRFVVGNPNNPTYDTRTVTNGILTLDKPYSVIHAGLPFTCDLETLDMDSSGIETMADKQKLISAVTLFVQDSRGVFIGNTGPAGDSISGLDELKIRSTENYDDPVALKTGTADVNIQSQWNSNGRVFVRQSDPVPLTILAVAPSGLIPVAGR